MVLMRRELVEALLWKGDVPQESELCAGKTVQTWTKLSMISKRAYRKDMQNGYVSARTRI